MTPAPRTPLKPFIGWVVVAHLPACLYTGYGMAVPVYRLKREAMADRNHDYQFWLEQQERERDK